MFEDPIFASTTGSPAMVAPWVFSDTGASFANFPATLPTTRLGDYTWEQGLEDLQSGDLLRAGPVGILAVKTMGENFAANIESALAPLRAYMAELGGPDYWAMPKTLVAQHPLAGQFASPAERYTGVRASEPAVAGVIIGALVLCFLT